KGIEWNLGDVQVKTANSPAAAPPPAAPGMDKMTMVITLEFPAVANDPKIFGALSKKVLTDFKNTFPPPYDVSYAAIPERFLEKEKIEIELGDNKPVEQPKAAEKPEIQLVIKGPVMAETAPVSPALILSQ